MGGAHAGSASGATSSHVSAAQAATGPAASSSASPPPAVTTTRRARRAANRVRTNRVLPNLQLPCPRPECVGVTFCNETAKSRHMRVHALRDAGIPTDCDWCGKNFTSGRKDSVSRHKKNTCEKRVEKALLALLREHEHNDRHDPGSDGMGGAQAGIAPA